MERTSNASGINRKVSVTGKQRKGVNKMGTAIIDIVSWWTGEILYTTGNRTWAVTLCKRQGWHIYRVEKNTIYVCD